MQTNKPVDPKWRKSGHRFDTLPSNVQASINHQLEIPPSLLHILFPSLAISVLGLLAFEIPTVLGDDDQTMPIPSFSEDYPASDSDVIDVIRRIPVPTLSITEKIYSEVTQKWLDGAESFEVMADGLSKQYLPLWVITYWRKVVTEIVPPHRSWFQAVNWLAEVELSQSDLRLAIQSLSTITWKGLLLTGRLTRQQTRVQFSKLTLTHFLSRQWLSDDHIDLMLYMLEDKLGRQAQGQQDNVWILDTIHTRGIVQAYQDDEDEKKLYYDATSEGYLQRFGLGLQRKGKIGGIFHSNGNHWVAIMVDLGAEKLLYGDPANGKVDERLTEAVEWYLGQHIPTMTVLTIDNLATPPQNLTNDMWNCGLYAYNALAHFFLGDELFMGNTMEAGDRARIKTLQSLISHQLELTQSSSSLITSELVGSKSESIPVDPALLHNSDVYIPTEMMLKIMGPKAKSKKSDKGGVRLAPIFQVPAIAHNVGHKRKRSAHDINSNEEKQSFSEFGNDTESGTDDDKRIPSTNGSGVFGRPKSDTLDTFTIDITQRGDAKKRFRCIGHGCQKIFSPRTTSRVLAHSQSCLRLTSDLRQAASALNANQAPGTLVDIDEKKDSTHPVATHSQSVIEPSTPVAPTNSIPCSNTFFGPGGRRKMHNKLDYLITLLFCDAQLPLRVADNLYWKRLFETIIPTYKPASSTTLMDSHIFSEAERVKKLQIKELQNETHISISFDGGSLRSGESVYTLHATTTVGKVILLEGIDGTGVSHTGRWIADFVLAAIRPLMTFPGGCTYVQSVTRDAQADPMSTFSVQIDNPSSFHPLSLITFRILPPEADLVENKCSLHVYYRLSSSVFIDPYELVQRQRAYTFVQWGHADLEKPVNAIKDSNVTLLINVKPPRTWTGNTSGLSFDVTVPLHARYGIPYPDDLSKSPSGTYHDVALEIPSAFIACREERHRYPSASPLYLSETQLHEAGFRPDTTTFLQLNYTPSGHVDSIRIPLGHGQDLHWVQSGTAIIILLSFIWVTITALQTATRLNYVSCPLRGKFD